MRLIPLKQWVCDFCGEKIECPEHGWLEWLKDSNGEMSQFKIVHHAPHSPNQPKGSCYHYDNEPGRADNHLFYFLGFDGLETIYSMLEGRRFTAEMGHVLRRLTLPNFEEARYLALKSNEDPSEFSNLQADLADYVEKRRDKSEDFRPDTGNTPSGLR